MFFTNRIRNIVTTCPRFKLKNIYKNYNTKHYIPIPIKEARKPDSIGKYVTIQGWLRTIRNQKNVTFLEVNDGSSVGNMQVILDPPNNISDLQVGCSVVAKGEIIKSLGKNQATELKVDNDGLQIVGRSSSDYPLQKKRHTLEFLRDIAHLRPRGNQTGAMLRVRNAAMMASHEYFQDQGFINIHTPIITPSDCEGAGELFRVIVDEEDPNALFGCNTYLTVSGQLEAEIFACSMSKVYTFGPTFRAEKGRTSRHLCEFWMLEMEQAFCDLQQNMEHIEALVKSVVSKVLKRCEEDINFFNKWVDTGLKQKLYHTLDSTFAVLSYTEVIDILKKSAIEGKKFVFPVEWGCDLQSEHEVYICEEYTKKPTFIIDFPKSLKPFYCKVNDDEKTVSAVDLIIAGIGELVGGSVREERLEVLERQMKEKNMKMDDLQWYLDLRRYGSVPHAGFGIGFERLIMFLTGIKNIRDVIPIPRTPGQCKF